jgi:hypothetical protein
LTPALTKIPFGLLAFLLLDVVCVFLKEEKRKRVDSGSRQVFVLPSAHSIVTEYLIE